MSILDTATTVERRIEAASPLWWVRYVVWAVIALLVIGVAWFVIDRLFFAPGRAHVAAVQASVDRKTAASAVETGKDALATTQAVQVVHDRIERITHDNTTRILAAPGASDALPAGVDAAFLAAVCLRDAYLHDPACVGVPGAPAAVSDRPDAGSAHPAG